MRYNYLSQEDKTFDEPLSLELVLGARFFKYIDAFKVGFYNEG